MFAPLTYPQTTKDYAFSKRSLTNLKGVHGDLVMVAFLALEMSRFDFGVTEGVRDISRQLELVEQGKSWTTKSRHLTGHAIDIAVYINGSVSWNFEYYEAVYRAFKAAADMLDIDIEWGGNWKSKDGPHIQLSHSAYPVGYIM